MGKGSKRRNEDTEKINNNWDLIFGSKKKDNDKNEDKKEPEKDESTKTK